MHSDINTVKTGNVTSQDKTTSISLLAPLTRTSPEEVLDEFESVADLLHEHDYASWAPSHDAVVLDNILTYIAGWVVRKLLRTLKCDICRLALVSVEIPKDFTKSYHLLKLKNNGGLCIASRSVVILLQLAEKAIRKLMDIDSPSSHLCKYHNVLIYVKKMIGTQSLFYMDQHALETQYGIDNHLFDLINSIVKVYFDLRQHHIAKMYTLKKTGVSIRHTANKTVLFKGQ